MADVPVTTPRPASQAQAPPTTVRIANLHEEATEADLREICKQLGSIKRIFLARNREAPNRCRGYAFVTFRSNEHAAAAVRARKATSTNASLEIRLEPPRTRTCSILPQEAARRPET